MSSSTWRLTLEHSLHFTMYIVDAAMSSFEILGRCADNIRKPASTVMFMSLLSRRHHRVVHGSDGPAGRVGSGRVGSGHDCCRILAGRVGSGQHFGFFQFFTDYFLGPESI